MAWEVEGEPGQKLYSRNLGEGVISGIDATVSDMQMLPPFTAGVWWK